jgi:thiamine-monophosphate kinase
VPPTPLQTAKINEQSELALLRQLRRRAARVASPGVRLGIGDDCALLKVRPGEEMAITTDLSIAGRHFRLDWHPPEVVGHRALARGLSDLAAMGARPIAAFLSLALPRELTAPANTRSTQSWMSRFLDGLLGLAAVHHTQLAGGDLAESPLPVADIVLVGAVPAGCALLRSGARPGDLIYVTGALGGAAAALHRLALLAADSDDDTVPPKLTAKMQSALAPHLHPQPRIAQGLYLQRRGLAAAAIDLSDGLSTDLAHLCEESGVAAEIDAHAPPIWPGATLSQALDGGEDYELLFTARPNARVPRKIADVPVTLIGRITKSGRGKPSVALRNGSDLQPLIAKGWEHFS